MEGQIFKHLFDSMADAVSIIDLSGTILDCNEAMLSLLGKKKKNLVGRNCSVLRQCTSASTGGCLLVEMKKTLKRADVVLQLKDRWFHVTTDPLFDGGKNLIAGIYVMRDISEQKLSEEKLKEQEERYKFLLENSKDLIFIFSKTGKILFTNKTAINVLEYDEKELIGKSIVSFLTKNSVKKAVYALSQEFLGRPQPEIEVEVKKKSGEIRILEVAKGSVPIREKGKKSGILVSAVDITERKNSEEILRQSESRFREILNNISSGVAVYDAVDGGRDFIFNDINVVAERIDKIKKEEILGKSVLETISGARESGLFELFQRVWKTGKPEKHLSRPYGDSRLSGWRDDYVFKLSTGQIVSVYSYAREEKGAGEQYKTIIQSSIEGFWIIDAGGRFLDVNKAYCSMIGYSREELLRMRISDVEEIEKPEETSQRIKRIKSIGSDRFETRHKRKDGRVVDIEVSVNYMKDSDNMFVFLRDITERKRTENKVRALLDFETLISSVSKRFINITSANINAKINEALEDVGRFAKVDRSYLCLFNENNSKMNNANEWCRQGIRHKKDNLQNIDLNLFPWFTREISKLDVIHIPSVQNLPPAAAAEKKHFVDEEIKSLIVAPLASGDYPVGFIGFDSVTEERIWTKDNADMLQLIAEIFTNAILRNKEEEEITKKSDELKNAYHELKLREEDFERINKFAIGRELRMIELKNRIAELEKALEKKEVEK
ncbi:PAS domain S-box protein [Candidatus Woesearchaeota archaeon]|nr:PAS domain S-box protein [Candidatus Woesearchaeota archaeon]